jgi:hypothetical protein
MILKADQVSLNATSRVTFVARAGIPSFATSPSVCAAIFVFG